MAAWTVNSLMAPVTRGTVAGTPRTSVTPDTGGAVDPPYVRRPQDDPGFASIMDRIFGGPGWRQYMGTGDRSGQVGGGSGLSPADRYNLAAANMLNTRNYMMQLANSTWSADKTRSDMQRLVGSGTGIGMNPAQTSQYNMLRQQYDDQLNQQAMRSQLAARVGSAPITPIQPVQQPRSSGWGMGSNMMGIGGSWGI